MKKRLTCILLFILVANISFAQDVLRDTFHYNQLGRLLFKGTLRNNELDGIAYTYYVDGGYHKTKFKNGEMQEDIYYSNDSLGEHPVRLNYYNNLGPYRPIKTVYYFTEGDGIGNVEMVEESTRIDTVSVTHVKTYYPNGVLKSEWEEADGKSFIRKAYYEDGKVESIGCYYRTYSLDFDTVVIKNQDTEVDVINILTGEVCTELKTGIWLYYDKKGNSSHKCYIDGHEVDCEDPRFYSKMK